MIERALAPFRAASEHYLREAAMEELRRRHPAGTAPPHREHGAAFWRRAFVPLYLRTPWAVRRKAIERVMGPKGWGEGRRWAGPPKLPPLSD